MKSGTHFPLKKRDLSTVKKISKRKINYSETLTVEKIKSNPPGMTIEKVEYLKKKHFIYRCAFSRLGYIIRCQLRSLLLYHTVVPSPPVVTGKSDFSLTSS